MFVIRGGDVVLTDRIYEAGSVIVDGDRIAAVERSAVTPAGATVVDASNCYVVPGFIDVHVHGVAGHDTLDGGDSVSQIARILPRYGVTAFCPTTVACGPDDLQMFLDQVSAVLAPHKGAPYEGGDVALAPHKGAPYEGGDVALAPHKGAPYEGGDVARPNDVGRPYQGRHAARVLPAHLESNFINPEFRGAQPLKCLRAPDEHRGAVAWPFTGPQILDVIEGARASVGIVTIAPELPGGIDLVRSLTAAGHIVSLGHSGSDFDTAIAAIEAGARHATHLFNRMTPIAHRAPGLAGAILARHEVTAELICDGYHVHPAMCAMAIAAKGPARMMAITDATSGAGQPVGSTGVLGGQTIHVRDEAAFLDDGTLAGSTLTMDRAFRNVATTFRQSVMDAALMCSTTPAVQLGLGELGRISAGAQADLVVLDRQFRVVRTFVAGVEVFLNNRPAQPV